MPRRPMCKDYKSCSLPVEKQTADHTLRYHATPKVSFVTSSTHVMVGVERDPKYDMYYVCTSDECPYKSILSSNPRAHFRECKFVLQDHQRKYPWLFKSSSDPSSLSGSSRRYTRIKPIGNTIADTAETAAAAVSGANARYHPYVHTSHPPVTTTAILPQDSTQVAVPLAFNETMSENLTAIIKRLQGMDEKFIHFTNDLNGRVKSTGASVIVTANMVKYLDERVISLSERIKNVLRSIGHNMRPAKNTEITASNEGAPFIIPDLSEPSSVYSTCTRDTPSPSIDSQNLPAGNDEEHEIKATIIKNIMGKVADQDQQDHWEA
ncbi:hypothetical protein BGZ54_003645, partial [Gamsiella multidivaricata]